jgi:hypothetical protein
LKTAPSSALCAWHIGDGIWHVQSRNAWLSKVLREAKLRRIAYGVIGGHLTIWETKDFEAMRPLMRRHKGRILR